MSSEYDRLPKEPAKAYEAFRIYCELGARRSLNRVVEFLGRDESYKAQLGNWSKRWRWVKRAEAWDKDHAKYWANQEERERYEADLRRYRDIQRQIAFSSSVAIAKALQKIEGRISQMDVSLIPDKALPSVLKDIMAAAHLASALQAQALGVDDLLEMLKRDGDA